MIESHRRVSRNNPLPRQYHAPPKGTTRWYRSFAVRSPSWRSRSVSGSPPAPSRRAAATTHHALYHRSRSTALGADRPRRRCSPLPAVRTGGSVVDERTRSRGRSPGRPGKTDRRRAAAGSSSDRSAGCVVCVRRGRCGRTTQRYRRGVSRAFAYAATPAVAVSPYHACARRTRRSRRRPRPGRALPGSIEALADASPTIPLALLAGDGPRAGSSSSLAAAPLVVSERPTRAPARSTSSTRRATAGTAPTRCSTALRCKPCPRAIEP